MFDFGTELPSVIAPSWINKQNDAAAPRLIARPDTTFGSGAKVITEVMQSIFFCIMAGLKNGIGRILLSVFYLYLFV